MPELYPVSEVRVCVNVFFQGGLRVCIVAFLCG